MLLRLKMPPAINQFNMTIDKNQAANVLRLLKKYQPETKKAKKERLMEMAKSKKEGQEIKTKKPIVLKFGLDHVTTLIENKKAKLVVIAHNVEPIEQVCWLPTLCRKKDVPYCIIKGKEEFDKIVDNCKAQFNDNAEVRRRWGGGIMGAKSQMITQRRERAIQIEQAKKLGLQMA